MKGELACPMITTQTPTLRVKMRPTKNSRCMLTHSSRFDASSRRARERNVQPSQLTLTQQQQALDVRGGGGEGGVRPVNHDTPPAYLLQRLRPIR